MSGSGIPEWMLDEWAIYTLDMTAVTSSGRRDGRWHFVPSPPSRGDDWHETACGKRGPVARDAFIADRRKAFDQDGIPTEICPKCLKAVNRIPVTR